MGPLWWRSLGEGCQAPWVTHLLDCAAERGLPPEEPAELPGAAGSGQAELHGAEEQTGGFHAARTTEERAHAIAMSWIFCTPFMTL